MRFRNLIPYLGGGGGPQFLSPPQIASGPYIWLVADDANALADGAAVQTLNSRTGGWVYESSTGPSLRKGAVAGKSALEFDTNVTDGQCLDVNTTQAGFGGAGVFWILSAVVVYFAPSAGGTIRIYGEDAGAVSRGMQMPAHAASATAVALYDSGPSPTISVAFDNTVTPASTPGWHIGIVRRNGLGAHRYFHDGVDRSLGVLPVNNARSQVGRRIFGNSISALAAPNTRIAEFFCYDGHQFTDRELALIYNYCALRYGFPILPVPPP